MNLIVQLIWPCIKSIGAAIKGPGVSFIIKQQIYHKFSIKNDVSENPFIYLPKKYKQNILTKLGRCSTK